MTLKNNLTKPTSIGLFWGIIGGIALIIATKLTTNGPLQITPYPILLIMAVLTVVFVDKSKINLNRLFKTGLLTFLIMSSFLYFYILTYQNPNSGITLYGHMWRLAAMTIFGVISSLIVSIVIKRFVK